MLSKWRKIENFNFVKSERVVMGYSDSRPTCTPAKSFNRQDFSQNNRVFYIPKTVGFGLLYNISSHILGLERQEVRLIRFNVSYRPKAQTKSQCKHCYKQKSLTIFVLFSSPTVTVSTPKRCWCELHNN